ncbi:amidohydrolase [Algimonas arctica]|uniref:Amidohydrolase n=1 Tax=Algimonas arctica TaxID=1479486 RepID=A0A8J3CQB6_9PROT|nr:amidohydrolase [Algimonas arctica]GHA95310.1 amidohydrolase [Algimonas arctica]
MTISLMKLFPLSACAVMVLAGCEGEAVVPDTQLITGATFITMEAGPSPEAMAIKDGRIIAIGAQETLRVAYPDALQRDFTGKTIIPGVVDSHVHARELGMDAIKVDLVGVKNVDDIVARIRAQRPDATPGEWIIGQGWDEGAFADLGGPGGYPTTQALSVAYPDTPIALEALHGFAAMANDSALAKAGITAATPDPEGGTILRRDDGQPSGVLLTLSQALLFNAVPSLDQAQIERAIVVGLETLAAQGVTSVHEAGMEGRDVEAFTALADRGELPIRVFGLLNGNDGALMAEWFDRGPLDDPQDRLDIGGIKVFYDGSLGSRTALMRAPYSDRPDTARPTARISLAEVESLGEDARTYGFQMAVHAIGDEANANILTSYERRLAPNETRPTPDHRWRIEHAQVVTADFAERAAALNVIASMQPSHAMGDSDWAEDRVGPRRIRRAYAWKSFQDAGVPIIFNSDLPGEPWAPMETLHFAVTRTKLDGSPAGGWYLGEALDREASLRAMTLTGAYAAFQDDSLGSLAVGKWADFVVLSDNPLTATDIRPITVEATYVAGQEITKTPAN